MFWKILLTLGLLLAGYATLKARLRAPSVRSEAQGGTRFPDLGARPIRILAYATLSIMLLGSFWYLWLQWVHGNQVMDVQVVNAATGAVAPYRARRRDIEGRVVRTLDGREIRLADVERMILTESKAP